MTILYIIRLIPIIAWRHSDAHLGSAYAVADLEGEGETAPPPPKKKNVIDYVSSIPFCIRMLKNKVQI